MFSALYAQFKKKSYYPCILSSGEYWISAGAAPPDLYFLMYLASSSSGSTILKGNEYAGEYSWSHTYLQRVHVMDMLKSGWSCIQTSDKQVNPTVQKPQK